MRVASPAGRHVDALDGLRGVAAIVVIVRHTVNSIVMSDDTRRAIFESPLGLALSAQGAVRVFFVLSGYVLASSLARGSGIANTLQFYVRRVFRIHPPYVAGLLFAWLAAFVYSRGYAAGDNAALTQWLEHIGSIHLDADRLLRFLIFPGDAGMQLVIGWTLFVEAIFSLALPLLLVAAGTARGVPLLAVAVAMLLNWPTAYVPAHAIDFAFGRSPRRMCQ